MLGNIMIVGHLLFQWVHESDEKTAGQGVKVEPTQFNMPNTGEDPKEYKKKQKEVGYMQRAGREGRTNSIQHARL